MSASWRELLIRRLDAAPAVLGGPSTWWSGEELFERAAGAARWLEAHGVVEGEIVPRVLAAGPMALAADRLPARCGTGPSHRSGHGWASTSSPTASVGLRAESIVTEPRRRARARRRGSDRRRRVVVFPDAFDAIATRVGPPTADDAQSSRFLHTSGTTGYPKAVPIREGTLARRVDRNATALGLDRRSVYVTAAGYHHIAGLGMIFVVLGSGGAVVSALRRSPSTRGKRSRASGPTHASARARPRSTCCSRPVRSRSRPSRCSSTARRRSIPRRCGARSRLLPATRFVQIYGQTEGSPIAILDHEDHLRALAGEPELLSSNGRAAPGVELEVEPGTADRAAESEAEDVGEIRARADHFFVTGEDGWLRDRRPWPSRRARLPHARRAARRRHHPRRRERLSARGGARPRRRTRASPRPPCSVSPTAVWVSASRLPSCRAAGPRQPRRGRARRAGAANGSRTSRCRSAGAFVESLPRNAAGQARPPDADRSFGGRNQPADD